MPVPADSLMLKRTRAFMQRNSSWVTFSMQNLWDSSFILTQCSYILDTCIRWLSGERKKKTEKKCRKEEEEGAHGATRAEVRSQERVGQGGTQKGGRQLTMAGARVEERKRGKSSRGEKNE